MQPRFSHDVHAEALAALVPFRGKLYVELTPQLEELMSSASRDVRSGAAEALSKLRAAVTDRPAVVHGKDLLPAAKRLKSGAEGVSMLMTPLLQKEVNQRPFVETELYSNEKRN